MKRKKLNLWVMVSVLSLGLGLSSLSNAESKNVSSDGENSASFDDKSCASQSKKPQALVVKVPHKDSMLYQFLENQKPKWYQRLWQNVSAFVTESWTASAKWISGLFK